MYELSLQEGALDAMEELPSSSTGVLTCESLQLAEMSLIDVSKPFSSSLGLTGYHTNVFEMNPLFEIPVVLFNLNTLSDRDVALNNSVFSPSVTVGPPVVSICNVSFSPKLNWAVLLQQTL